MTVAEMSEVGVARPGQDARHQRFNEGCFLTSPTVRRLVVGCKAWEGTAIATHLPVVLKLHVGEHMEKLTKRVTPKPPAVDQLRRVVAATIRQARDRVGELLEEEEWRPGDVLPLNSGRMGRGPAG